MRKALRGVVAAMLVLALAAGLSPAGARADVPPGTYIVDSAADAVDPNPSDNTCGQPAIVGTCTLRAALEEADGDGLHSTILFAHPMTIVLDPALGPLVENQHHNSTTIDASPHWVGTWPNGTPGVFIEGAPSPLLEIDGDWVYLYGIGFRGTVQIRGGSNNWIGGTDPGQRNLFLGGIGLVISNSGTGFGAREARLNRVAGNHFGTEDGITAVPAAMTYGIYLAAGTERTTIAGNLLVGATAYSDIASITLYQSHNNTIRDNTIGLDATGAAAIPNSRGIMLTQSNYNTIGPGNVVAGNSGDGIVLEQSSANNTITNSTIGLSGLGNGSHGVRIASGPGNAVNACTITHNTGDGIYLEGGAGNSVTGNVIGGNGGDGLRYGLGMGNAAGNYIGMDRDGADIGNGGYGIYMESGGNVVGGLEDVARQWIGFNDKDGIRLVGAGATDIVVANNMVGLTPGGQQALNGHHGISAYGAGSGIYIGAAVVGNVVMGSAWSGIVLVDSSDVTVQSNRVGSDGAGADWGNGFYGIVVVNGAGNLIRGNEVAYSGLHASEEGIRIQGATATGNTVTRNSVHDNGGPGISLVGGGNADLAAPVIDAATACAGPLSGTACAGCTVEVFADAGDEGRTYLGTTTAGASGAWTWSGPRQGAYLTATATDGNGNTSAFSAPVPGCRQLCLPLVRRTH